MSYGLDGSIEAHQVVKGQTGNTALVGATLMFEILCLLADTIAAKR
jgi:hypothetical protein